MGQYLPANVRALAPFGWIITIGRQSGSEGTLDFAALIKKKATIMGRLLRGSPPQQKAEIMRETHATGWPLLEAGSAPLSTPHYPPNNRP